MSVLYSPEGDNLTDEPRLRSAFQKAIGDQNLEVRLNRLADDPKIQESIAEMNRLISTGQRTEYEVMDFYHNKQIDAIFQAARKLAWQQVSAEQPKVAEIKEEERAKKAKRLTKTKETFQSEIQVLQRIYK